VRLSPLGTSANSGPTVPAPEGGEYGAVAGMRIGWGNRSTRKKPARVTLCKPQISHAMNWH
jgi:hypothetical protein